MIRLTKLSWTAIALAAAAVILSVVLALQMQRAAYFEGQLAAIYRKSFLESVDLVANLEVNLEKLALSADRSMSEILLSDIARQSDNAQDNLSSLPLTDEAISGTMKFVNQVGDFSRVRMQELSYGAPLSDKNRATLIRLQNQCVQLNQSLRNIADQMDFGGTLFYGNVNIQPMAEQNLGSVEYPELIYDGPFSDGDKGGAFRAISGDDIDADGAIKAAKDFLGERVIDATVNGQSLMPIPCFNVTVKTADGTLELSITEKGGKVLQMIPDFAVKTQKLLSVGVLIDAGAAFLDDHGFGAFEAGFYEEYDGMAFINFTPIVDGACLYPDMIKLQISRDNGYIVGFDAGAYYRNHVKRGDFTPELTVEDAAARVSDLLTVTGRQLCLIPLDTGERLAYEFAGRANNSDYYVYIDAFSGDEVKILKIITEDTLRKAI